MIIFSDEIAQAREALSNHGLHRPDISDIMLLPKKHYINWIQCFLCVDHAINYPYLF